VIHVDFIGSFMIYPHAEFTRLNPMVC